LSGSFKWLNVTQFLGALNDNVFKLLVIFFFLSVLGDTGRERVVATASAVFVLPFLLFSNMAGVLADRLSKRRIIVLAKYLEIAIMAAGCVVVWLRSEWLGYGVVFLMAAQSALFGPSKYGIVPELVRREQLSWANSLLTLFTYLAIIIGTFLPSYLLDKVFGGQFLYVGFFCVAVAVLGTIASHRIAQTPAMGSRQRISPFFFVEIFRTVRGVAADRYLLAAIVGSGYFLFIGAFIQQNVLFYGQDVLGLGWIRSGYLFPVAALGIGLGALLAGRWSGRNIEFGIVPIGALGLTVSCIALGLVKGQLTTVLPIFCLLGLSSGLFLVPLATFIQYRSPEQTRGQVLAAESFLGFTGAALAAGLFYLFTASLHLGPRECFVVIGVLTGILTAMTLVLLPDFFVRFLIVLLTRGIYRIRTVGIDCVPVAGPALLMPNHVTWVDALLISATLQRRVRFVMSREVYSRRWLNPVFRLMQVIPISPADPPRRVVEALHAARAALEDGYLVCIFPEGAITRNGNMRSFRTGWERIVRGMECPVIPVHIGGAWGSVFSYYEGRLLAGLPKQFPYPVTIQYGNPLSAGTPTWVVRAAVQELSAEAFEISKRLDRTLAYACVRGARRHWFLPAVADSTGKRLSHGQALISAIALGDVLCKRTEGEERVGVLLPASVGGALTNEALTLLGKVPVNLNFTVSVEARESAVRQAGIKTIVSSRTFLAKLGEEPSDRMIFLEDLAARIGAAGKVWAALRALVWPVRWIARYRVSGPDDIATIIFSSGSTGEPKGVMLSHHNILSNVESFLMVVRFHRYDRMCGVLPFFHSFGYTCTLWCPLISGFSAYYHPNPLDGAKIAECVRTEQLTAMLATPTFLLTYIRKAAREDFATLRLVVTGAEKLKKHLADSFEERFGIRPIEGYGATELAPVAALSVPDVVVDRVSQKGAKEGSVGHPVPGVAIRIVDPESGTRLATDTEGMLIVKGPNVMRGYLDNPAMTADALRDGWYWTGDLAKVDDDGFVFLQGRLSRFSKIGGEMVPHVAIEDKILQGLCAAQQVVFVTAVPDERKGEQLVLLYTPEAGSGERVANLVRESELPNLWKPRHDNLFPIAAMPMLGSGKLDLAQLKRMAAQAVRDRSVVS
jgi:acyl-[acyl-carrier-protein]-phospholipid O-acyltransferase/long-chain-fatty-acid--[acyl-carrier-protein] ligase